MGDGAYSFSLTTFSPSGKLVQIEYALAAVNGGKTSLGIKGGFAFLLHHLSLNCISEKWCGHCYRKKTSFGFSRRLLS